jgi:pSer/pThr/pTyr-binding forkhead associated (FHA) protein
MYFVVDLDSTNGTAVNDKKVKPQLKVQIGINATVAFGRICFVFTHPFQLYRGLRKEILGM